MDRLPLLDDETLQRLYAWIDEIPLSRPKKSIARDFSDGILTAEVIAYYFPKLVQMHNYSSANSIKQKQYNWQTLNRKVLKRLHIYLSKDEIDDLVACRSGAIEHLLVKLQIKIATYREKRPTSSLGTPTSSRPETTEGYSTHHNGSDLYPTNPKQPELRDPGALMEETSSASPTGSNNAASAAASAAAYQAGELLQEKDNTIAELRETIQVGGFV